MEMVSLTIKNYRCFADRSPARIELGRGFTAFVGANNSGKSSLLRFFYELKGLWGLIPSYGNLLAWLSGGIQGVSFHDVYDQQEVFCDSNERPLEVEIVLTLDQKRSVPLPRIGSMYLSWNRKNEVSARFDYSPHGSVVHPLATGQYGFLEDGIIHGPATRSPAIDCVELFQLARTLSNSIYIGPFRNAINTGAGRYYELSIGTEFTNTWHEWKTGENKATAVAIERVTEDICRIFGFSKLEIAASQRLNTLQVSVNGKPYKLRELGAGLAQFILVFGNAAFRRPDYIFIDEPELNLHPSLQVDFLTSLASYAKEGIAFATDSIGLARTVGDRIYSLKKDNGEISCRLFEQTPNYAEFIGELSFSSFKELGCSQILFVEGVTDVRTVQQFLRMINKDHQVVILPLGGDQLARADMEVELAELKRITPNVAALVDSEKVSAESEPAARRKSFADSCGRLGFKICLTKLRAIENYLSDRAIKTVKGDKYRVLEPYQKLEESSLPWAKHEN
jgi:ABC-type cobalamin/Fe3+-siderophores transport system ATPase subunit